MTQKPDEFDYMNPDRETRFDDALALADLLRHEVVFINSSWWKKDFSEESKNLISVHVNCSDVFAWGCADAVELPYDEIETVWRMWQKDEEWGPAVWAIIKRKEMPQDAVKARIQRRGIWNLDELNLTENTTDQAVKHQLANWSKDVSSE